MSMHACISVCTQTSIHPSLLSPPHCTHTHTPTAPAPSTHGPGLTSLDLSYNHHLLLPLSSNPPQSPLLTHLLTRPRPMQGLRRLDLGHCRLGDGGLLQVIAALPTLAALDRLGLATNRLSDRACAELFAALSGAAEGGGAETTLSPAPAAPAAFHHAGGIPGSSFPSSSSSSSAAAAGTGTAASPASSSSDTTSLPSPPSAGATPARPPRQQPPQAPPLLQHLRCLDLCDNGVQDTGTAALAHALALRAARLQANSPPLLIDLRLNPLSEQAAEALVRAAHALRWREGGGGGWRVGLNTRFVNYWC